MSLQINNIENLNNKYISEINDLYEIYPYMKTYSNIDKYSRQYNETLENINKIRNEFEIFNDRINSIQEISVENLEILQNKIEKLKKINEERTKMYYNLKTDTNTSIGLYNEYEYIYGENYTRNVLYILFIITLIILIFLYIKMK